MKQKGYLYAAVALLVAAFVWTSYQVKRSEMGVSGSGARRDSQSPAAGLTGRKAPGLTLVSPGGKKVSLAEFEGKNVVLLDFWATWCPPCRAAMPRLAELEAKYGSKGLKVISINQGEDGPTVSSFVKETEYKPLVLLDDGTAGDKYRVKAIPTIVIVDKTGKIRSVHEGYSPMLHRELEKETCKLLGLKYTPETGVKGVGRYERH